jgi:hypothetical protein
MRVVVDHLIMCFVWQEVELMLQDETVLLPADFCCRILRALTERADIT